MGGETADLTVEEGAKATLDVILNSTSESNGKLLSIHVPGWENAPGPNKYHGGVTPW